MTDTTASSKDGQPTYQRFSILLLGLLGLFYGLSMAASIIVPLLFALLLAILLNPVVDRLCRWRCPRLWSIGVAVVLSMVLLASLGYFIVTQAMQLGESLPDMERKLDGFYRDAQRWAASTFDMRRSEVDQAVEKVKGEGLSKSGAWVGQTLTTVGALFAFFFLLPVFTFMLLLYKRLLITFMGKLVPPAGQPTLKEVLNNTSNVVQGYLVGLIIEAGIIAAMNWVGLMLLGIKYALLLAVIGAVLNLIPYIGMIIATILPMAIALATKDASTALWVLGLYLFVQFVDNNFIVPRVVGSRVQLNALVSIVAVMVGGALWGIPGMFLSLPVIAIVKVVFDRIPSLEPFGYVLGEGEEPKARELLRLNATRT